MIAPVWLAMGLTLIAVLAGIRFWPRDKRVACLQPVLATLFYCAVFPPLQPTPGDVLVLLTAGATPEQISRYRAAPLLRRLPEAPVVPDIALVPDLATALRQWPHANRVRVVGFGLSSRDRDAARGWSVSVDASPVPPGMVAWWPPGAVTVGQSWFISGRTAHLDGGTVALLDPAGHRVATALLTAQGEFTLAAHAVAAGNADYRVQTHDKHGERVDDIALPLQVVAGAPLRVRVLAAGPDPELKYLRRWALDAGLLLQTQTSVGGGLKIGAVALDAPSLANQDLLLLDERAWRALSAANKATLKSAVRAGLGLLLRITGPLSASERQQLRAWGFAINASDQRVSVSDALEHPAPVWRPDGQGRMALWWLSDTWQLVLAGKREAHGQLWSEAFSTLARARGERPPSVVGGHAWVDQRVVLCGLSDTASVHMPSGKTVSLLRDQASAPACAAYWPSEPGWHDVVQGERSTPVWVSGRAELAGVLISDDAEATAELASQSVPAPVPKDLPGPSWPWWLAWLAASALSWWLERKPPPSFEGGV